MNPALRQSKELVTVRPFGALRNLRKKAVLPSAEAGWTSYRFGAGAGVIGGSYPRKLSTLIGAYGGTDDSVSWVYSAVNLIQQELASYPYQLLTERDEVIAPPRGPKDLREILNQPNKEMTYFDFTEYRAMDQELAGNSYWLKDQQSGLGQPLALMRLRPEFVKVAVDPAGLVIGYVYQVGSTGLTVPYDREDVIHFKRPNPLDEYYGMGTVEAIQRALGADLAQTDHIIGFFSDGARLSGVLTTKTLSEIQFNRFKEQFYEEYSGDQNAHKILIAEEGTRFDPISQPPGGTGVVELRSMTKDEILSAFGIHEFLLGGAGQSGVYKMEEAQHIFSRRMVPKARRDSDKLTNELTLPGWKVKFNVDVAYSEPKSVKVKRAGEMLSAGATVNESRREMDLPPYEAEWADTPNLPQGVAPFGLMGPGGQPHPSNAPNGTPPPEEPDQPALEEDEEEDEEEAVPEIEHKKEIGAGSVALHERLFLIAGFEPLGDVLDLDVDGRAILEEQARIYAQVIPEIQASMRQFFLEQRGRILRGLGLFEPSHNVARLNKERLKRLPKNELTISHLWDITSENRMLGAAYKALFSSVTKKATRDEFPFDTDDPEIRTILDEMGLLIVGINEETRLEIASVIEEGMRRGYSISQIAHGFPEENYLGIMGVFDEATEARATVIARTETARAYNLSTLVSLRAEKVLRVKVFDGPECGWKTHDDEDLAHGSIRTMAQAFRYPIVHPQCRRAFAAAPIE